MKYIKPTLKEAVLGTAMCSYGFLKLFVGTTATFCSEETKDEIIKVIPLLKSFYGTDETIASKAVESCFVLFGLYSIVHGLDELHLLAPKVSHVLHSRTTDYVIYGGIGTFLTAFYSAVIYTSLPIQKDKNNMQHYKLLGLVGGLSFLIMVPLQNLTDKKKHLLTIKNVFVDRQGQINVAAVVAIALLALSESMDGLGSTTALRDFTELLSITL